MRRLLLSARALSVMGLFAAGAAAQSPPASPGPAHEAPSRPARSLGESLQGAAKNAYESAIAATAAPHAPWYVVPADHKWFTHLIVVEVMVDALEHLNLKLPSVPPEEYARLQAARVKLEAE